MYDYYRQRGPNPLFYEDPHYNTSPPFQIHPFPCHLQPPPPLFFFWLNWWSPKLRNIMDLHLWSLGTLVPEGP